jgi:hypothetical protein
MAFYRRRERIVMGGGREWLWEESEDGCGWRERIVIGGRECFFYGRREIIIMGERRDGYGRRDLMVLAGGRG